MGLMMGHLPGVHVYLYDILIATRSSQQRLFKCWMKTMPPQIRVNVLFSQEHEYLGFKFSNAGTVEVERKIDSIVNKKQSGNLTNSQLIIALIHHFVRFISNSAASTTNFNDLMRKLSRLKWEETHSRAFAKLKKFNCFVQNQHFDVNWSTRVKRDS